jgi:hypothetical protein
VDSGLADFSCALTNPDIAKLHNTVATHFMAQSNARESALRKGRFKPARTRAV